MSDQILWFASRGSGIVSLVLSSAVVCLGLLTVVRWQRPGWPRFLTVELHRNLALLSIVFLGVHIVTAILDPYVSLGSSLPSCRCRRRIARSPSRFGVISVDLLLAIVTSLLRGGSATGRGARSTGWRTRRGPSRCARPGRRHRRLRAVDARHRGPCACWRSAAALARRSPRAAAPGRPQRAGLPAFVAAASIATGTAPGGQADVPAYSPARRSRPAPNARRPSARRIGPMPSPARTGRELIRGPRGQRPARPRRRPASRSGANGRPSRSAAAAPRRARQRRRGRADEPQGPLADGDAAAPRARRRRARRRRGRRRPDRAVRRHGARAARAALARAVAERGRELAAPRPRSSTRAAGLRGRRGVGGRPLRQRRRRPADRPRVPPRPYERGVGGRPTLVQNVESLAPRRADRPPRRRLVPRARRTGHARHGARHGRRRRRRPGRDRDRARDDRWASSPSAARAHPTPGRVLLGGYFGAWLPADEAPDLPLDPAGAARGAERRSAAASSSFLGRRCVRRRARRRGSSPSWPARAPAQCGPCVFGLGAIADATGRIAAGTATRRRRGAARALVAPAHRSRRLPPSRRRRRPAHSALRSSPTISRIHSAGADRCESCAHTGGPPDARAQPAAGGRAARAARRRGVAIDPIACDGYGMCAELLPELIALDDWGFPIVAPGRRPGRPARARATSRRRVPGARARASRAAPRVDDGRCQPDARVPAGQPAELEVRVLVAEDDPGLRDVLVLGLTTPATTSTPSIGATTRSTSSSGTTTTSPSSTGACRAPRGSTSWPGRASTTGRPRS